MLRKAINISKTSLNMSTSSMITILDTDLGDDMDDCWALAQILQTPELNLQLITTSGLGYHPERARVARRFTTAANKSSIQIGLGCKPINNTTLFPKLSLRNWISQDIDHPDVIKDGVGAIIRLVHQHSEIMFIQIGPMSNLAAALQRDPSISSKINLVTMAGSIKKGYGNKTKPSPEFNVTRDLAASQIVLSSGFQYKSLIMAPLDICGTIKIDGPDYQHILETATSFQSNPLTFTLLSAFRSWHQDCVHSFVTKNSDPKTNTSVLFDCVAIYMAQCLVNKNLDSIMSFQSGLLTVDEKGYTRMSSSSSSSSNSNSNNSSTIAAAAMAWKNDTPFRIELLSKLTAKTNATDTNNNTETLNDDNGIFDPATSHKSLQSFTNYVNKRISQLPPIAFNPGTDNCISEIATLTNISQHKLRQYRSFFLKNGYVVIPEVFSSTEMLTLRSCVGQAVAARKRQFDLHDVPVEERDTYTQQFTQCINLWEDAPSIRPFVFHPKVAGLAAALLGTDSVRIWQDQALIKPPSGSPTAVHQDHPLWPIAEPQTVTAWTPLDALGSTFEGGALGYIPGSHKSGIVHFSNIVTGTREEFEQRDQEVLKKFGTDPIFVEVPPGSIAYHHGMTAHLSMPNKTNRNRPTFTTVYMAKGATRGSIIGIKKQGHPNVERKGSQIKYGEVLNTMLMPIAFPLHNDGYPKRPPSLSKKAFVGSRGTMPGPDMLVMSEMDEKSKL